jgi:hypothetical protein
MDWISQKMWFNSWQQQEIFNFYKMTNKMQLRSIIYRSLTALHVLSDIFAHHQEHLICNYSFWFYSRVSLSADVLTAADNKTCRADKKQ